MNTIWNAQLHTHTRVRRHSTMWAVDVMYNDMPMRTQIASTEDTANGLAVTLGAHYQIPATTTHGVVHPTTTKKA